MAKKLDIHYTRITECHPNNRAMVDHLNERYDVELSIERGKERLIKQRIRLHEMINTAIAQIDLNEIFNNAGPEATLQFLKDIN